MSTTEPQAEHPIVQIQQARIINPKHKSDSTGDLLAQTSAQGKKRQIIDASHFIACPGFIDLYARLCEPGFTRKGTIASESYAALAGGFTTVLCAPDTDPVIDSTATVELIRQRANAVSGARIWPMAAITRNLQGELLSELATLQAAGCVAASGADQPIDNTQVMLSVMEYAASFDLLLIMTPRDAHLAGNGCVHAGAIATRLGLPSIPAAAETVALAQLLELCEHTQVRLHVSRLSTARAVQMIDDAKQRGLNVTADVGIHHLLFTSEQIKGFDVSYHSQVPFRTVSDRAALRTGIQSGVIDAICSDHAPHDSDAKLAPFASSAPGLSAFDAFLPLLLSLPKIMDISLLDLIALVTTGPARVLGKDTLATLATGSDVNTDLIMFDPQAVVELSEASMRSMGKNSPLLGANNLMDCSDESASLTGQVVFSCVPSMS